MKWIEIKEQSDINDLLERFGYFHDSCLKEMYMWTETYVDEDLSIAVRDGLDTNVKLFFQRQYTDLSAIEILFENVTRIQMIPSPENYDSIINDAIILKFENDLYWADDDEWHPKEDFDACRNWISAKRIKWREVNDGLGKKNRYAREEL